MSTIEDAVEKSLYGESLFEDDAFENERQTYKGHPGRGLFYRAEKDGQVHYLMGTHHFEHEWYKTHLSAPLKAFVKSKGIQKLYIEVLPPSLSEEVYPPEIFDRAGQFETAMWKDLGLPLGALETMALQAEAFGQTLESVITSFHNTKNEKKPEIPKDVEYTSGNTHAFFLKSFHTPLVPDLTPAMREIMKPIWAKMNEAIFFKRNRAWIKKISKFTTEHKCLITCGAKHLFTSQGVVALLRKDGWKVEHSEEFSWPTQAKFEL